MPFEIVRGDITKMEVDAIVNAANEDLLPGGGICGAIHSAAGPELAAACRAHGPCETGGAAKTPGFGLYAKYVIHAVGPVGERPAELQRAYESTLAYIDGEDLRSVAFCCISTGIFGFPIEPATKIALETVRSFLECEENRAKTDRIVFVVFLQGDVAVYDRLAPYYFPIEGAEEDGGEPDDE